MKFKITKATFLDGLKSVQNIVSSKTSAPVMQNVRLEAQDGFLRMTTTDIDISIDGKVECETGEAGATTLPVKILSSMVSCSADGVIEVEVDTNDTATIFAGSAKYRLSGISEKLFPTLPNEEGAYSYTISSALLKEMLRKTAYAASQDDTRRNLRGVLMRFKDGKLTMVATDGRRLALVEKETEFANDAERDVILPMKAVQELQRALVSEGDVVMRVQGTQVSFNLGKYTVYSKLVDDNYPNYQQVIPSNIENSITLDRQMFISAIERVGVVTSGAQSIRLVFSDNVLQVSASETEIGYAKDELPIKYVGEVIEIVFNATYLMDPLKAIDDDEVTINLDNGHSPAIIRCSVPFLYVIMPLREN